VQVFAGDFLGPVGVPLPIVATGRQAGVAGGAVLRTGDCSVVGTGHTAVHCVCPPGVGTGYSWSLAVAGQSSALSNQTTSYGSPLLIAVTVSGPGIVGGDEPGTVPTAGGATVTLTGANFGPDSSRIVLLWDGAVVPIVALTVPHTTLFFTSLPGSGAGANVTLTVGGQKAGSGVRLPFAAPRVTSLRRGDSIDGEASLNCADVNPDGRPAHGAGGSAVVVIRGVNFGRGNATVAAIQGVPCTLLAPVSDFEIVCQTEFCTGAVGTAPFLSLLIALLGPQHASARCLS
jgi:hypothetical protein